jgi:carboxypeptidase family protein
MRTAKLVIYLLAVVLAAVAQTDRGSITGTISDATGAVVANAAIEAKNVATGQTYTATSTQTGNYTLPQLPAGSYEVLVNVQGFKKYTRQGLSLAPTQVMRIDVALEVGSSAETVTVTAEATLMKTESGEVSQTVTGDRINNLPLLSIGEQQASAAGVRNPWALATLVPGIQYVVGGVFGGTPNIVANGAAANTASYRIEGMDAGNNGTLNVFSMEVQPSAEAIQEVAVQTSNFAAEYGAVGGGLFNATMRSGTNQYHGSLYDYNVNEAYNASQPYTGLHNKARRNDYGGSLGGPVRIPKIYNGTNKTFFFWNFEQYRERQTVSTTTVTVPIAAYRIGDFSQVIPASSNQTIKISTPAGLVNYTDPLNRTILAGQIFDPQSTKPITLADGTTQLVRDPFVGNKIDPTKFDTVAKNIQNLIPPPAGPNARNIGNNFNNAQNSERTTEIPSLKLDQTVGNQGHLSFYWSGTRTADQYPIVGSPAQPEGFPPALSTVIGNFDRSYTIRVNYDYTISPTLLAHLGLGYQKNHLWDDTPVTNFDAFKELGLRGQTVVRQFPTISIGAAGNTGGMSNMGPLFQTHQYVEKPAVNLSTTWVKGNHSYKFGAEWRIEGNPQVSNAQPPWTTAGAFDQAGFPALSTATTQTSLEGLTTSGGTVGFGYASFLLGQVTGYGVGVPSVYHIGRQQWGLFVQDTWKVTRKLTLDYGLRWDYGTYSRETYGRQPSFAPLLANPTADNHPGALQYEATCHCTFANNYPYAVGPRLGVAYQINSKTVFRGGFGVVYNTSSTGAFSPPLNYQLAGVPAFGQSLFNMQDGPPSSIHPSITLNPGGLPSLPGTLTAGPLFVDPNAARPARQYQWSVGFQRELNRDLVVEASYVANRGVWWSAGALAPVNSMSQQLLTKYGFTVGNPADGTALSTQIGPQRGALAARAIPIGLPYGSFPTSQTLLQSLLPYPQFTGNISPTAAPLGKTWYDSLQATVTQRLRHGLTVNGNFTWSKNLDLLSSPDIFNRDLGKNISANDLPLQFRFSAQYVTPRAKLFGNNLASYALGDWTLGWYAQYQSAPIIARPPSAGGSPISRWLGRGPGPAEYVTGQSLWSTDWTDYSGVHHTDPIDINCHCFDPTKTIVLNPSAWKNVPDGQWSSNQSTLRDYRGFRYPTENANFGRTFRIKEKVTFNVRMEFTNIFNRTRLPQPASGNGPPGTPSFATKPSVQQTGPLTGLYSAGFGTVVPTVGTQGYRTGTLVGRITF